MAVLKLRLFFCVGSVGLWCYICVVAYYECELYVSLKCTYFRFYTVVSCLFGTAHAVHYCNYSPAVNTVTSRKVRPPQTYLRINLKKTTGLSVNLSPVVLRHLKVDRNILPYERSNTIVVSVL